MTASSSGRSAPIVVWAIAAIALVLILANFLLQGVRESASGTPSLLDLTAAVSLHGAIAAFIVSGALIVSRQSRNVIGWLLLIPGVTQPLATLVTGWLGSLEPPPEHADPLLWVAVWATSWAWIGLIFPIFHLLLTFPDGRLLSTRWRIVVLLEAAMTATMMGLAAFGEDLSVLVDDEVAWSVPNPIGFVPASAWDGGFDTVWNAGLLMLTAAGVAAFVIRFRRGTFAVRQQLKWPVAAAAFFGVVYGVAAWGGSLDSALANLLFGLSLAAMPISVAIAVLRYRLYDIDRIISRTVSYAILSGLLASVFAALVLALQALLGGLVETSTVSVAASTLLVAALFQPLRRRIQATVDRRFNRARANADEIAAAFAARLRDQVDLATVAAEVDVTVRRALAPSVVSVWMRRR